MRALGVLVLVSACYSPAYTNCVLTCATSGTCPDGYECDGMFCRSTNSSQTCDEVIGDAMLAGDGTISGDGGRDKDSDLVPDDRDNCPAIANTMQYNEDGDSRGDACDPCPVGSTSSDDADPDTDGVGNGCDPNPTTSGERLTLFDGLNAQPAVNSMTGTWSFDGQATINATTSGSLRWDLGLNAASDKFYIRTVVHLLPGGPALAGTSRLAGTIDTLSTSDSSGLLCGVGTSDADAFGLHQLDTNGEVLEFTTPLTSTTSYLVNHERTQGNVSYLRCTANGNEANMNLSSGPTAETGIGLQARRIHAAFDYILVVETP